jgi:type IV pilus assembly protein PilW
MKQNGFTLLELLMALVLSLFLFGGLLTLFFMQKRHAAYLNGVTVMSDNARMALLRLHRMIRMAGLIGCVNLETVILKGPITLKTSLIGWRDGYGSDPLPKLSRLKRDSDVIQVQWVDPKPWRVKSAHGRTIAFDQKPKFNAHTWWILSDCTQAEAVQWSKIHLKHRYHEAEMAPLHTMIYYIGDTGRKNRLNDPIYALYERDLNRSINNPIEIVEGVEKMRFEFGVMQSGRMIYVTADQVTHWESVRSVMIHLLMNSVDDILKKPTIYLFLNQTYRPHDRMLRQQYDSVVSLRQRVR